MHDSTLPGVHPHRLTGQFIGVAMHVFSVGAPNCMFTSQNGFAGSFIMQSASLLHTSGLRRVHAIIASTTTAYVFIMAIVSDDACECFAARLLPPNPRYLLAAMARKRKETAAPKPSEADERPRVVAKRAGARGKKRAGPLINVRHMARRDINRVWEFLKVSFRAVNAETVEYQRPRSKRRFEEVFDEEGIEQLVFEVDDEIVAYCECSYEVTGSDNWINPRYFEKRDMKPLFVDELAVHPDWHGRGVGTFALEQLQHLARVHGLNHLVLEVAENNTRALDWYKKRSFKRLDAAIFMACPVETEPELLPPRELTQPVKVVTIEPTEPPDEPGTE